MGQRLVLVDGSGFIFRAFHALPPMTREDGTPVNAVFGFCNMLTRLLKEHTGTHLAVIFDAGRTTFRNAIDPRYKAHRPEPPEELIPQFALVRDATRAFAVPAIELDGFEADDLIASYAAAMKRQGGEVVIVSSDKDLMQLLGDGVSMLDPIKQTPIGPDEVMAKFGVVPGQMIEMQALMGDSVDNVPGVPGIGPKGAAQLIGEYGTLETILEAAASGAMKPSKRRDALVAHAEDARISRKLVELRCDVALPAPIADLAITPHDDAVLQAFLDAQGFKSIKARLGLNGLPRRTEAQAEAKPVAAHEPAPDAPFGPYETIDSDSALETWIAAIRAVGRVAVDTETADLNSRRTRLIGISLAIAPGRAAYIPLGHELGEQLPRARVYEALAPVLNDPAILKIFHNAKFDLHVLAGAGLPDAAPIDDTMLISYALEAGAHGHGMDELSALHLDHKPIAYDEVTGTGRNRIGFSAVPIDRATAYAAEDADVTLRLWLLLRPRLREARALALYETLERRLVPVLLGMERAGVMVDRDDLIAMSAEFARRMDEIQRDIEKLVGHAFNLGSPKQLGEILFDEMKLPGGRRTKTGAWGTDAAVLEELAEVGLELPARILDWRQLQKLKSTYADALVGEIDVEDRRVHTSFAQAIAATGRLSSNDPNLQNIPIRTAEGARIRRAFIAAPGQSLISADYSQIELRLLAHVADIPALKRSFGDGEDIHARTASEVFGVPMEGMDPLTRRRAKAINFGIIYGISAFGLARQLGIENGEAKRYIDAYFARYPEIRRYMNETREFARTHGYVTTPFGRRCYVPGIADKNPARRGYAERQAINAPLQGGAADIIKRAMVRLPAAIADAGLDARLLLQVHDELLFEAPRDQAEAVAQLAREVMQNAAALSVPLLVEAGIGPNWSDAH
ncbi:DNA polymerase I [Acidiphilium sp. AL]|uniref:DNA polymerase I n=1 Tax=Acidiphilium iwatense TaxID=768198 RepID=A0ABS9E1F8_9PROT|nr:MULTISPECIES: DNA polymerase I [Acidiphilium]MCF3948844.1 DNA polymerase I [Acidiphilium iwatense]MCU4161796.1 DNA polymerase I [Acidiphilium sp. AL]